MARKRKSSGRPTYDREALGKKALHAMQPIRTLADVAAVLGIGAPLLREIIRADERLMAAVVEFKQRVKVKEETFIPVETSAPKIIYQPDIVTQEERLRTALRAQGKDGAMIEPQLEVAALAWGQMMRIRAEMGTMDYSIIQTLANGGNKTRRIVNPLEDLYMKCRAEYQRSLQACGLNFDSKDFSMEEVEMEKDYDQRRMERHRTVVARAEN